MILPPSDDRRTKYSIVDQWHIQASKNSQGNVQFVARQVHLVLALTYPLSRSGFYTFTSLFTYEPTIRSHDQWSHQFSISSHCSYINSYEYTSTRKSEPCECGLRWLINGSCHHIQLWEVERVESGVTSQWQTPLSLFYKWRRAVCLFVHVHVPTRKYLNLDHR